MMRSEKISKRIITAMLAGTMLLTAAMTGCGGENSSGSNNTPGGTSAASEVSKEAYKDPEYTLGKIVKEGSCGDDAKWQLDENGLLVISGSGYMNNYETEEEKPSPWRENNDIKTIIVLKGIMGIGGNAFRDCTGLTSINIPDSMKSIGNYAFSGCKNLTGITIPDSVIFIKNGAFEGCTGLTSITIPDSVTSIGSDAFCSCTGLTSITISGSLTSIGNDAFRRCTGLTGITIPDSVTGIGDRSFAGCTGLTDIIIPESVTKIGNYAFEGCTGLTSITIPDSVTEIGDAVFGVGEESAFAGCTGLISIKVDNNNSNYCSKDDVLYNKDLSKLIFCPNGKKSVTIPDSVTSIGFHAFWGCKNLTNITIPDSVTSIVSGAFEDCTSLTNITIPDSVTSIGGMAFLGCESLTGIKVDNNNPNYCSKEDVLYNKDISQLICCPKDKTNITIPNSVTNILGGAFLDCTNLTKITIPDSVTDIGYYVFDNCQALTEIKVDVNNSYYCSENGILYNKDLSQLIRCPGNKTSVTIPNSVTSIGYYAFRGCTGLTDITIPDSVTNIDENAFYGCKGFVIHGKSGSYAEQYAKDNNITFEAE